MMTAPQVEERTAQAYVAIQSQVPMHALSEVIPRSLRDVFAWLDQQGVAPAGAPFIRYHTIAMPARLDVEVGVPMARAVPGNGRIATGVLPAGRYATLVYTGIDNGIAANSALLTWGAEQGLVWDSWAAEDGEGFGARLESFLTNPDEQPDPARWDTEVAIRLADDQSRAQG